MFETADEEPRFATVAVTAEVYDDAARLVAVHGLRAYYARCSSRGSLLPWADPGCERFAVFDRDLREAAAREGFGLVPDRQ